MKKIILSCLLLVSTSCFAHWHTPTDVIRAFHKQFPTAGDTKWEYEHGNYEANFRLDGQKTSATYNSKGEWLETERAIDVLSLPPAANRYIEGNFKGKIPRHASIITSAKGETTYEAHLKGADYIFDASGKFIKTEKD